MSSKGITPEGQQVLGNLIRQCRCSDEVRSRIVAWMKQHSPVESVPYQISQEQFARWLTAVSGIVVTESALGRLERGEGRTGPPLNVLIALCKMEVLRVDDQVCGLNRVVGVLCGKG